jgi:hypothetical protein
VARLYKVSADTAEKEKIIGGVLTLAQGGWCAGGFLIAGGLFILFATLIHPVIGLIIGLPPGALFIYFFAFYKKMDLPLLTYLIYKNNMDKKTKTLVNDMNHGKTPEEFFH